MNSDCQDSGAKTVAVGGSESYHGKTGTWWDSNEGFLRWPQ